MRKIILVLTCFAFGTLLWSCSGDDEGPMTTDELTQEDISNVQAYDNAVAVFKEGEATAESTFSNMDAGGRLAECATTSLDTAGGVFTLTVDFGDECTGPFGYNRSGVLIYEFTLNGLFTFDFSVTFQDYSFEGYTINGEVATGNFVVDGDVLTYEYTISNGSVTTPDGRTVTLNQTQVYTLNTTTGILNIEGDASGSINGETFTYDITSALQLSQNCIQDGQAVPIAGVADFTVGAGPQMSIDYGDGTCDRDATVTVGIRSFPITL